MDALGRCSRCPGLPDSPPGVCPSWGSLDAPVLVVGMAPGRQELLEGQPFVGGSGKVLFGLESDTGLRRDMCRIVNTINCWPGAASGAPTDAQLSACRARFEADLSSSQAQVVLCLGGDAFRAVTGLRVGIENARGYLYRPEDCVPVTRRVTETTPYLTSRKNPDGSWRYRKGDPREITRVIQAPAVLPPLARWIVPTLHPAAVMREGLRTLPVLQADIARAVRFGSEEARPLDITFSPRPVPLDSGPIAVDIETSGELISRVGVSDGTTTWSSGWGHETRTATQAVLADESRWKIAHNWQFDMPRLEAAGVKIPGLLFDTMLAAHLLNPDLYKGLGRCAPLYLDLARWKHTSESDQATYNATDALVTRKLFDVLWRELENKDMLGLFCGTIMPATRVLMLMTQRGIAVDRRRLEEWQRDLSRDLVALMAQWNTLAPGISPNSPAKLARFLYGQLKLPRQIGKYGSTTTDEAALRALLAEGHEPKILNTLLKIREISKLKQTYSTVPLGRDGHVHPHHLPTSKDTDRSGAATGRLASHDPNIQNQPPEARRIFVPSHPDLLLVEADYSQIELRIASALSGDAGLGEALSSGDVHAATMRLLGCDRTRAKNVIFGSLYGAGPRKLASILKQHGVATSERECRALQAKLASAYPALWAWREAVAADALNQHYLRNPFGRIRYFYTSSDTPQAIDYLPQSTAADILWDRLVPLEIATQRLGGAMLATVHDSVLVELPRSKLREGIAMLHEVMEVEFPQVAPGFRVPVKVKTGENWGQMTDA